MLLIKLSKNIIYRIKIPDLNVVGQSFETTHFVDIQHN